VNEADALLTLAEIALGFAGFTGVIVVFSRDRSAPWEPIDAFRVTRMLSASLAALFFSLLPEGLFAAGLAAGATWRVASLLLLAYMVLSARRTRRDMNALEPRDRALFDPRFFPVIIASALAVMALLLLNASGWLWPPGYAAYYFGILHMLGFAAFQFVRIIFVRPASH
jgi:hypothetical protein